VEIGRRVLLFLSLLSLFFFLFFFFLPPFLYKRRGSDEIRFSPFLLSPRSFSLPLSLPSSLSFVGGWRMEEGEILVDVGTYDRQVIASASSLPPLSLPLFFEGSENVQTIHPRCKGGKRTAPATPFFASQPPLLSSLFSRREKKGGRKSRERGRHAALLSLFSRSLFLFLPSLFFLFPPRRQRRERKQGRNELNRSFHALSIPPFPPFSS